MPLVRTRQAGPQGRHIEKATRSAAFRAGAESRPGRRSKQQGQDKRAQRRRRRRCVRGFRSRVRWREARCGRGARACIARPEPAAARLPASWSRPASVRRSASRRRLAGSCVRSTRPGADQAVDRAADRRSAAPDRGGDLVQGRRLVGADRGEQLAAGALGAFGRAVGDPILRDGAEARRKRRRCRSPKHVCSLANIWSDAQHCIRKQRSFQRGAMDCFVAALLAMTA